MNMLRHLLMLVIWIVVVSGSSYLCSAEELPRPLGLDPKAGSGQQRFITIDFDDVDIHLFIKYISELTGKNFVIDKSVQGNVTIISPTKISAEEAYKVFESVLEVNGFTTVESGSVTKILPAVRARSQNVQMINNGMPEDPMDRIVTQIVPLKYTSPEELKKILTPLVSQSSVLIAHDSSGMLIITETLSNIQKLLGIIEVLDVQSRENEVAVIPLYNASSASLSKILATIYQSDNRTRKTEEGVLSSGEIKIVPYERVNALVVLAGGTEMDRVKSLIKMLDTKVERAEGNIRVYYLQNATAVEMAKVLNALPEQTQNKTEGGEAKAAAISKNVKIMADEETNSLVITATKDEYQVIEDVIKKLDIPRRMVYLEALIMEVDADKVFDVGVQWAGGGIFSDATGVLVGGFSGANGYDLLPGISAEDPSLSTGFSLGVIKQGIRIGDITFPNIAAILNAYKTDSEINIISTPQILTTDNKKAEISVGENVPYITSRNTTASEQDYTQYEYKDVATKLSIVPHINQADTLRLEIETEVVRIKGTSSDTPTTYKRTASTTVILSDNDTIVIGGIMGRDAVESEWKVPFLGDIPGLGWLFKTHSSTSTKTNMFIFITPRIVRNPADLAAVALSKGDVMKQEMTNVEQLPETKNTVDHAQTLVLNGFTKLKDGKYSEAKDFFNKALQIDPNNPYAKMNMGYLYEKEGDSGDALKMYREVIKDGSAAVANQSTDAAEQGKPLLEIARERIEEIQQAISDEK